MTSSPILPIVSVSATVSDDGNGNYSAHYNPDPAIVPGTRVSMQYNLDTEGWKFGTVSLGTGTPFSDLDIVDDTVFTFTNNGFEEGTYSFSVQLLQTAAARGMAAAQIDSDPEVKNGPPP